MRYLALAILLCGCTSTPEPVVQVRYVDNPKKDQYIDRLEAEASEAGAALKAVKDFVPQPQAKLVDLTIVRLEGIKPATQKQVDTFKATLGSPKELKKAEDKAERVDSETNELWGLVEMVQIENEALRQENEAVRKEQAYAELRSTCFTLGSWFAIASALLLIGSSVLGLSKRNGIILSLFSGLCFAAPFVIRDVVDSLWFKWMTGVTIGFLIVTFIKEAYGHHKEVICRLPKPKAKRA